MTVTALQLKDITTACPQIVSFSSRVSQHAGPDGHNQRDINTTTDRQSLTPPGALYTSLFTHTPLLSRAQKLISILITYIALRRVGADWVQSAVKETGE